MPNESQITNWNSGQGEVWAAAQAATSRMFESVTDHLLAIAAPATGERVLDIGCGTGDLLGLVANLVGGASGDGTVVGVDISRPMLEVARRRFGADSPVHVVEADAQVHPFEPASFDLAISRFGVMFFDDPVAAFANIARALTPDGRLAFACWQAVTSQTWMGIMIDTVAPLLAAPLAIGGTAPGPLAFADPTRVTTILTTAGFSSVTVEPLVTDVWLGADAAAVAASDLVLGPTRTAVMALSAPQRAGVAAAIERAMAPFETPDGVRLPAATWVVSADR